MRESGGGFAHEFGDANRSGGSPGGGQPPSCADGIATTAPERRTGNSLSGGSVEATLGPNAAGVLRGATTWAGVAFLINSLLLTALM